MSIETTVQAAILERRALLFAYDGDDVPDRVGHPHALFLGPQGETRVDVLQVDGFSTGAGLPAWRSFHVEKIRSAEQLDASFEPAPDWDPLAEKYAGGIVAMV